MFSLILAQEGLVNPILSSPQGWGDGVSFFSNLIRFALGAIMILGILFFFFMFIYGGIEWISSGGDKGKTSDARKRITNALTGLVILLLFWAIVAFIELTFGLSITGFDFSNFSVATP